MTFVITQGCCNDATCVAVCPVDCIHPRPDEPGFATAEMLYIDPAACIDCGACADACPVDAVYDQDELPGHLESYLEINEEYYRENTEPAVPAPVPAAPSRVDRGAGAGPYRVAVVGSGPAGMFAVAELLTRFPEQEIEIEVFDRLPTPWGLVRNGVAPDHHRTRQIADVFHRISGRRPVRFRLNVEIGVHISHGELLEHHHAVIYAVGAFGQSVPGVPGAELPGSVTAARVVAWYNGHPDESASTFRLGSERAVVVGNGNVALDVARVLLAGPDALARTDVADHALAALRDSAISEVVVLGRRGVADAAYTAPELLALGSLEGVDVVVEGEDPDDRAGTTGGGGFSARLKTRIARQFADTPPTPGNRRVVLRHLSSPLRLIGDEGVESVEIARNAMVPGPDGRPAPTPTGHVETLPAGLVVWATGFSGTSVEGVPFDEASRRIPHSEGRVLDPATASAVPGVYCTGWAKRGPSGVIGTNRSCARATVGVLVDDLTAGGARGSSSVRDRAALEALLAERRPDALDREAWLTVDASEREAGREHGRPRVKLLDITEVVTAAGRGAGRPGG